jgi:class 3 adenylate cyclase
VGVERLRSYWHGATRLGIAPGLPAEEARYVVLVNTAAILGVLIVASYLPLLALFGDEARPYRIVCWTQLPIWSLPLWFNYRRRHLAAANYLAIGCLACFTGQVVLFGDVYGHQYFLLLVGVGSFLAYPPRHRRFMALWATLGFVAYVGVVSLAHLNEPWFQPFPLPPVLQPYVAVPVKGGVFLALASLAFYSRRSTLAAEAQVRIDREKSEALLLNILPPQIAERLKAGEQPIADGHEEVTVLFADIAGFTPLAKQLPPGELVALLNQLFSGFDASAERHGLEKIKTIGDAYMVAGGLPDPRPDHAQAVAAMAFDMIEIVRGVEVPEGVTLDVRVGIHTGPVVAGVIGRRKFSYDLWGDTVNTASRMESHGQVGTIQVSAATKGALGDGYTCRSRGEIEVKGKGPMEVFELVPPPQPSK